MRVINWLKKNYPNIDEIINDMFSEKIIRDYMMTRKYVPARLTKDFYGYAKDTLFLVKKSGSMMETEDGNAMWDGCHNIYGLFKCGMGITSSGYHHVTISTEDIYAILNKEVKKC